MDFRILEIVQTRQLLSSKMSHADLADDPHSVTSISDVLLVLANFKKSNQFTEEVRSGKTELHQAVVGGRLTLLALDVYNLSTGLFDRDKDGDLQLCGIATGAAHPGDTMNIIAFRDFDWAFGTELMSQFEPMYAGRGS